MPPKTRPERAPENICCANRKPTSASGGKNVYFLLLRSVSQLRANPQHLAALGGNLRGATSASARGGLQAAGSSEEDSAKAAVHQGGAVATQSVNSSFILLSTAQVLLNNQRKGTISCRALLDNGSQSCLISCEACQKLNLNVSKTRMPVTGIRRRVDKHKGPSPSDCQSRSRQV